MVLDFELHKICNPQTVEHIQTISSETTGCPPAPHNYDAGALDALPGVMEKQTALTSSDEEKANDDEDVDDEDLVSFDEFVFASQEDALISLRSDETICS